MLPGLRVTHPNRGSVRALDSRRVEAGEEGAVTHRVTLSEDQRTNLTAGELRVQPPDLQTHTQTHTRVTLRSPSTCSRCTDTVSSPYSRPIRGGVADRDLDRPAWFHCRGWQADAE